jgi:hypothetical protein
MEENGIRVGDGDPGSQPADRRVGLARGGPVAIPMAM